METIIKHGSIPKAVCIPKFDITEFIANISPIPAILEKFAINSVISNLGIQTAFGIEPCLMMVSIRLLNL